MAILPVGPDPEEANRLDLAHVHLLRCQLGSIRHLAGPPHLSRTLRTGAGPAQLFERIGRLVPVRPGDGQKLARPISQDVERTLTVLWVS